MKDDNTQVQNDELLTIDNEIEKLKQEYGIRKKDLTKIFQKICLTKGLKFITKILTLILSGAVILWLPTSFIPKIILTITTIIASWIINFKTYKYQKKQEYEYDEMLQTITNLINQITEKRKERKKKLTYKVTKINNQPSYNYTYTNKPTINSPSYKPSEKRNSLKLARKKKIDSLRTNVD